MPQERIQKIIAAAGLCSRREAETWIEEGRVHVNDQPAKLGQSASREDRITINGAPLEFPKRIYLMMNKPAGFVTTLRGLKGQRTVQELLPYEERLYPVGRLDRDTTGLLIFTNDGEFANRVMHPRYQIEKTYYATLNRKFEFKDAERFKKGIRLDEGVVYSRVRPLPGKASGRRVEVKLHQGFKHVVKRIFEKTGYQVRELSRVKVGSLRLDVPPGAVRLLKQAEVDALLSAGAEKAKQSVRPLQRRSGPRPVRGGASARKGTSR